MNGGAKSFIFFPFIWERMWRCALSRPCDINNRQMIQIYNDSKWFRYIRDVLHLKRNITTCCVMKNTFPTFLTMAHFLHFCDGKNLIHSLPHNNKTPKKQKQKVRLKKLWKGGEVISNLKLEKSNIFSNGRHPL